MTRLRALSAIAVASIIAGACGSGATTTAPSAAASAAPSAAANYKLAGIYGNTSDAFWFTVACGAAAEAKKLGIDYKNYSATTTDVTAMSQNLDAALLTKPQGVALNPFSNTAFSAKTGELMKSGVPVVTTEPMNPQTDYMSVRASQDGSPYADKFNALIAGMSGEAYVQDGSVNTVTPLRYQNLVAGAQTANPNLKWLDTAYDSWDVTKGTSMASSIILAHPNLKLIVAAAGPEGQAVAAAVKAAGKQDQIKVIGFDAVPAEIEALKDGTISMLIAQPAAAIGAAQVDALVDYLKANPSGGPVPVSYNIKTLPMGLLTKDNLTDPANAGFIYSTSCSF